jgi:hypothetical protein
MCRYFYRDGLCANSSVKERACIGLESCPERTKDFKASVRQSCGYDNWYGLYCDKYKRFFCAGIGNCETFEEYMEHFANHMGKPKDQGSENEM